MFTHAAHMWMCGAMVVGAVVVLIVTGSPSAFAPALICMVMMMVMMRAMDNHDSDAR